MMENSLSSLVPFQENMNTHEIPQTRQEYVDMAIAEARELGSPPSVLEADLERLREGLASPGGVRAALEVAYDDGLSAARVASAEAAARQLRVPRAVALGDLDYAKKMAEAHRIERNEHLARWAGKSPENAALARDDGSLEKALFAVSNFGNAMMHTITFDIPDIADNIKRSLHHGVADNARSFYGAGLSVAELIGGEGNFVADLFRDALAMTERARPEEVTADGTLGKIGYGFVRSIPQQVGNILAAMVSPTTALSFMGVQIGGGSYAKLREEGVRPIRAAVASALDATVEAPLERLSLGRFMDIFKSSGFRDTVVKTLGASATEGLTEYVQKYPEVVTELWGLAETESDDPAEQVAWWARTVSDARTLQRAHEEGLYEAAIGALWGGLGGGARVLASREARARASAFAEGNKELSETIAQTQTKQAAPDALADALESTSEIFAQSVYIPAQSALDMAAAGRDVLTPLGITQEQARQAAESGVDLEVTLSALQSRLGSEDISAIADIMRERPDALNALEAGQVDAAAEAQAVVEDARARISRDESVRSQEQRLVREMTPLVGPEAARQYGALHTAQARAFSDAYGVDAAGLMARRRVEQGVKTGEDGALLQTDNGEGKQLLGDRFAAMPMIEADSSQWFGPGKAIDADGSKMRRAVQDWTRTAFPQGTTVTNADRGWDIRISPRGIRNTLAHGGDDALARSVPFIPQIIEGGIHLESMEKKQGLISHIFANKIRLDGQDYVVGFVLREDRTGNRFYDHELTEIINPDSLNAGAFSSEEGVALAARANRGDVMNILREKLGVNDGSGQVLFHGHSEQSFPRASVSLDREAAIIRLFKGANLSSIPHESAHIFVDDLAHVISDNGGAALNALRESVAASRTDMSALAPVLDGTMDVEGARGLLREARAELEALEANLAGLREAARATKKSDAETRADMVAAREVAVARRRELLAMESALAQYVRHMDGISQARADMTILRRFAGVQEDGDLTEEQWKQVQEHAARGFEQYLSEGKSPSTELRGVFSRMRAWLKNLYAGWKQYVGAELSDDVRLVFDRMLATDEQLRNNDSVRAAFEQERDFLSETDLAAEERSEIDALRSQAEAEVLALMDRRTLRERRARYKEYYREEKEALREDPFWSMISELMRRETRLPGQTTRAGGINKESLVRFLGEEFTNDLSKKMPGLVNAQGGGGRVDSLALEYHLADGDADVLANMLYDAIVVRDESVNKLARRHAEARLAKDDAQGEADDGLLAGDEYAAYLEAVERAVSRLARPDAELGEYRAAVDAERATLPERWYREQARRQAASMPVDQLKPHKFSAALSRALNERTRAMRRKKPLEAVRAAQRARMAFSLLQEVGRVRTEVDKIAARARQSVQVKPGTYNGTQTEALRQLVTGLGLSGPLPTRNPELSGRRLADLVALSMEEGNVVDILPTFPDWLLTLSMPDDANVAVDWRRLNIEELRQADNLVGFLRHTGREQSLHAKNSLRLRAQTLAEDAAKNMASLPDLSMAPRGSLRAGAQKTMRHLMSYADALLWQLRRADAYSMGLDGSGERGVMEREIFDPIIAGENRQRVRLAALNERMAPLVEHLLKSSIALEKKHGKRFSLRRADGREILAPQVLHRDGRKRWDADMLVSLALNMGNAGNMQRILGGYQDLDAETVAVLLGDDAARRLFGEQADLGGATHEGLLSAEDWRAIQGIWDAINSQFPDMAAAHKRQFGFEPAKVEAVPLSLNIGGQRLELPGGYYPIAYDPQADDLTRAREEKQDQADRSESMFPTPVAKRGFAQGRMENVRRPVLLSTTVFQRHLNDVTRFIELGEIVRLADRVTQSAAFRSQYSRAFGKDGFDAIRPNLKGLVRDENISLDPVMKLAERVRNYSTFFGLGWNIKSAVMQLTAVFPAMHDIGVRNVLHGLGKISTHPVETVRAVWDASPYMRSRAGNIDQDIQKAAQSISAERRPATVVIGGKIYTWSQVVDAGMLPIIAMDTVATCSVWSGAYVKRMRELGGTRPKGIDATSEHHAEAVRYADGIVKQSNPDYDSSSRSALLRSKSGAVRLVTMFASAATLFAQRSAYLYGGLRRGKFTLGQVARFEAYENLLPAAALTLLFGLVRGLLPADDDDDMEKLGVLTSSILAGQYANKLPVFGNFVAATVQLATGFEVGGRRPGVGTVLDTPLNLAGQLVIRGGKALRKYDDMSDEEQKAFAYTLMDTVSYVSRVPVHRFVRNADRGYDQWERGEGTPLSLILPAPGK